MKLTIGSLIFMVTFVRAIAAFPARPFEGLLDPSSNSELDDGSTYTPPSGTDPSTAAPEVPTFTPPAPSAEPSDSTPTSDSVPTPSLSSDSSEPSSTPSSDTQSSSSSDFQSSATDIISSTSPSTTDAPTSNASSSAEQPSTTPTSPSAPSTTDSQPSSTSPSSILSQPTSTPVVPPVVDKQAYLDAHNSIREAFGVDELSWSDDLQAKAQSYAEQCQLKHSDGALGPVGENLAAATGSFTARRAVRLFARDKVEFDARTPELSHFTQIVWKATTQLGCGVASCDDLFPGKGAATYHVCLYDPVGNVVGQEKENLNLD